MVKRNDKEVVLIWIYKDDRTTINEMCEQKQMSQADIIEQWLKEKKDKEGTDGESKNNEKAAEKKRE